MSGSATKRVRIPLSNVKFTKTGRAVADMDALIERELARIRERNAKNPPDDPRVNRNGQSDRKGTKPKQ